MVNFIDAKMTAIDRSENIPILLLAAGESKRLGQPKQLVMWKGKQLIAHAIENAQKASANVVVVLGNRAGDIQQVISPYDVQSVLNPEWPKGMGKSISVGMGHVSEAFPTAKAVLIMLVDQPFITDAHLQMLVDCSKRWGFSRPVISKFNDHSGVPAIFPAKYFASLMTLDANEGAKKIMGKLSSEEYDTVPFDGLHFDIDTQEDVQRLHQFE